MSHMKRRIIWSIFLVLVLATGHFMYTMWEFANGEMEDSKRRNEFFKKDKMHQDSLQFKPTIMNYPLELLPNDMVAVNK